MGETALLAPKFRSGDTIVVDDAPAVGHCRTPWYLRGHRGVVTEIQGVYRDPTRLAYHQPGLPPLTLYKVRFRQSDLWPAYRGAPGDELEADIYEPWLKHAGDDAGRKIT